MYNYGTKRELKLGQALYRKYRSKKLSEIVGQEHITKTLDSALKSGKISHAYLFTGPRGVGKTSIARILAHEVNDLPYKDESVHLDIIEIDAASNRRIDEIRDLRDKVHIAPTSAKYKVYIIDEVHMLTKEAFNALLKTLEEPPAHVIFILATTELHKLPDTIISRTQRFTFKPVELQKAVEHLKSLAKNEEIDIDDEALELLAKHGNGSFRDSISLLDQIRHSDIKVTKQEAEKLIGIASAELINDLLKATMEGSPAEIVGSLEQLKDSGVNPGQAAKQIADETRLRIVSGDHSTRLINLLGDLVEVSGQNSSIYKLEIALFKANLHGKSTENIVQVIQEETPPTITKPEPVKEKVEKAQTTEEVQINTVKSTEVKISGDVADWWQEVLNSIKSINNTLYGMLRMAKPEIKDDTLNLGFNFDFHRKKAADTSNMVKIQEAIKQITGSTYSINPVLIKAKTSNSLTKESEKKVDNNNNELDTITNIFGGGEVLES